MSSTQASVSAKVSAGIAAPLRRDPPEDDPRIGNVHDRVAAGVTRPVERPRPSGRRGRSETRSRNVTSGSRRPAYRARAARIEARLPLAARPGADVLVGEDRGARLREDGAAAHVVRVEVRQDGEAHGQLEFATGSPTAGAPPPSAPERVDDQDGLRADHEARRSRRPGFVGGSAIAAKTPGATSVHREIASGSAAPKLAGADTENAVESAAAEEARSWPDSKGPYNPGRWLRIRSATGSACAASSTAKRSTCGRATASGTPRSKPTRGSGSGAAETASAARAPSFRSPAGRTSPRRRSSRSSRWRSGSSSRWRSVRKRWKDRGVRLACQTYVEGPVEVVGVLGKEGPRRTAGVRPGVGPRRGVPHWARRALPWLTSGGALLPRRLVFAARELADRLLSSRRASDPTPDRLRRSSSPPSRPTRRSSANLRHSGSPRLPVELVATFASPGEPEGRADAPLSPRQGRQRERVAARTRCARSRSATTSSFRTCAAHGRSGGTLFTLGLPREGGSRADARRRAGQASASTPSGSASTRARRAPPSRSSSRRAARASARSGSNRRSPSRARWRGTTSRAPRTCPASLLDADVALGRRARGRAGPRASSAPNAPGRGDSSGSTRSPPSPASPRRSSSSTETTTGSFRPASRERLAAALPPRSAVWNVAGAGHCHHANEPAATAKKAYARKWEEFFTNFLPA